MPKYPFANFSLSPRAWTLVVLESGRIDFTQTFPDKSAMTEAEIVRQVAALPQAAQRRNDHGPQTESSDAKCCETKTRAATKTPDSFGKKSRCRSRRPA